MYSNFGLLLVTCNFDLLLVTCINGNMNYDLLIVTCTCNIDLLVLTF